MIFTIGMECPKCGHNNVFMDYGITVSTRMRLIGIPHFENPLTRLSHACEKCGEPLLPDIVEREETP